MPTPIRIGTRESQLAVWQATEVQKYLKRKWIRIGTRLYKKARAISIFLPRCNEIGVQGIFTRSLDYCTTVR